jgi:hypothetical protein
MDVIGQQQASPHGTNHYNSFVFLRDDFAQSWNKHNSTNGDGEDGNDTDASWVKSNPRKNKTCSAAEFVAVPTDLSASLSRFVESLFYTHSRHCHQNSIANDKPQSATTILHCHSFETVIL